ncbi:MAG TPA: hypothetical protein VMV49_10015 [Candidatus Deferrimicrobium sp.]|nr:hypothetical protein [Candidatus Deferrimicrobium sp.]
MSPNIENIEERNNKTFISVQAKRMPRILILILSFIVISFLMKYISEWTHEFLGHCGFGALVGGGIEGWYVSWFWPAEFGYAIVNFPISLGNFPRAVMMIGGITACFIAALVSHSLILIISKKKILPKKSITTSTIIIFHVLFWYGFWAFVNSVGYLILGGLVNFGDIRQFSLLTGTPLWVFIIIGFLALVLFLYLVSFNSSIIFHPLLPNVRTRLLLSVFWLILPLTFLIMLLNPAITVPEWMIPAGIGAMLVPTLIMVVLGNKFQNNIIWITSQ